MCTQRVAALVSVTEFLVPNSSSLLSAMQRVPRDPSRPPDLTLLDDCRRSTLLPRSVGQIFHDRAAAALVLRAPRR
jgi:hypothetical protein